MSQIPVPGQPLPSFSSRMSFPSSSSSHVKLEARQNPSTPPPTKKKMDENGEEQSPRQSELGKKRKQVDELTDLVIKKENNGMHNYCKDEIAKMEKEIRRLNATINGLRMVEKSHEQAVMKMTAEREENQSAYKEKIRQLEDEVKRGQKRIVELQQSNYRIKKEEEVEVLETKYAEVESRLIAVEVEKTQLEEIISQMCDETIGNGPKEEKQESQAERIEELETMLDEASKKITRLESQVEQHEHEAEVLAYENKARVRASLEEQHEYTRNKYQELWKERDELKETLLERDRQANEIETKLNMKIDNLREERNDFKMKAENLRKISSDKGEELKKAEKRLDEMEQAINEKAEEIKKLKRSSQSRQPTKSQLDEQNERMAMVVDKMTVANEQVSEELEAAKGRIKELEEEMTKMRAELERRGEEQERIRTNAIEMVEVAQKEQKEERTRQQEEMAEKMKTFEKFKEIAVKSQEEWKEKNDTLIQDIAGLAEENFQLKEELAKKDNEIKEGKAHVEKNQQVLKEAREEAVQELQEKEKKIIELKKELTTANEAFEKNNEETEKILTKVYQKLYDEMGKSAHNLDERMILFKENEDLKREIGLMKREQVERQLAVAECQKNLEELQKNLARINQKNT